MLSASHKTHICRRKSGYASYGPPPGWPRGARLIVLREGRPAAEAETYLRLEDSSRLDQAPSDKGAGRARQRQCNRGACKARALGGSVVRCCPGFPLT